jgi:hypothetical protein
MSPLTELIGGAKVYGWGSFKELQPSFESIATVSLGGSTASATFSSIPATYKHLQIRCLSSGQDNTNVFVRFNSDANANYSQHRMTGDGSGYAGSGNANSSEIIILDQQTGGSTYWNGTVVDILDYADTNKYKTVRSLNGVDRNGTGFIYFMSGNWRNTSAISDILIRPVSNNLNTNSIFALYGIKGA